MDPNDIFDTATAKRFDGHLKRRILPQLVRQDQQQPTCSPSVNRASTIHCHPPCPQGDPWDVRRVITRSLKGSPRQRGDPSNVRCSPFNRSDTIYGGDPARLRCGRRSDCRAGNADCRSTCRSRRLAGFLFQADGPHQAATRRRGVESLARITPVRGVTPLASNTCRVRPRAIAGDGGPGAGQLDHRDGDFNAVGDRICILHRDRSAGAAGLKFARSRQLAHPVRPRRSKTCSSKRRPTAAAVAGCRAQDRVGRRASGTPTSFRRFSYHAI
jgi:hypothetical protein